MKAFSFYAYICKIYTLTFQQITKVIYILNIEHLENTEKHRMKITKFTYHSTSGDKYYCLFNICCFCLLYFSYLYLTPTFTHKNYYLLLFYIFLCDIIILLMLCSYSRKCSRQLKSLTTFMMLLFKKNFFLIYFS